MDYQSRLNTIIAKPGNKSCADCNGRNPRWASISLGVFVCIRCCGIHRGLGTHISKMKSTTLDKWTPSMLAIFEALDNEIANTYWECNLPKNYNKPVESSTAYVVEMFLRDKYDRKLWIRSGPDPVSASLQPKIAAPAAKPVKIEEKTPVSRSQVTTDLLFDNQHSEIKSNIPHLPAASFHRAEATVSAAFPDFPSFPVHPPLHSHSAVRSQDLVQFENPAPLHFSPAMIHPQAVFYADSQVQNSSLNRSLPLHQTSVEAEKNLKISQVMSMYGTHHNPPIVANNEGFKPLGAIAAQNFFNQNSRTHAPYPSY